MQKKRVQRQGECVRERVCVEREREGEHVREREKEKVCRGRGCRERKC